MMAVMASVRCMPPPELRSIPSLKPQHKVTSCRSPSVHLVIAVQVRIAIESEDCNV
jgi:hypothetical protein